MQRLHIKDQALYSAKDTDKIKSKWCLLQILLGSLKTGMALYKEDYFHSVILSLDHIHVVSTPSISQ